MTPRERFSVAHEIGHWIVSEQLGVPPAETSRDYWRQEEWVNSFAGCLLVPERLIKTWLAAIPETKPVPPIGLWRMATRELRVSQEVLARVIVRVRPATAFLKLIYFVRRRDAYPILKVQFSTGSLISTPVRGTHLADPDLQAILKTQDMGQASLRGFVIGKCPPQNITLAWRRSGPADMKESKDTVYWLALAPSPKDPDTSSTGQTLFDTACL
ncbi:MAG: ImmA/IrrE family metallo-endopeptidase [Bryobacterales bacterium]|nr:ImmA/IrrE family metallo-endopeptidase [Bryobacterales bacterium]